MDVERGRAHPDARTEAREGYRRRWRSSLTDTAEVTPESTSCWRTRRRPERAQPSGPGQKSWTGFESPVSQCPGRGLRTSSLDPTPRRRASRWRLSNRSVGPPSPPRAENPPLQAPPLRRKLLPRRRKLLPRRRKTRQLRAGDMGRTTSLLRVTDLGCWTLKPASRRLDQCLPLVGRR
jgi:hypothetical protein